MFPHRFSSSNTSLHRHLNLQVACSPTISYVDILNYQLINFIHPHRCLAFTNSNSYNSHFHQRHLLFHHYKFVFQRHKLSPKLTSASKGPRVRVWLSTRGQNPDKNPVLWRVGRLAAIPIGILLSSRPVRLNQSLD